MHEDDFGIKLKASKKLKKCSFFNTMSPQILPDLAKCNLTKYNQI